MRRLVAGIVIPAAVTSALMAGAAPALAATHGHGGGGGGSATPVGADISYPQCGHTFPASPAFGIVGLNGGLANDLSPCFGPSASYPSYAQSELYWAVTTATGTTTQPKASLYLNTADPGNVYNGTLITDWPDSGTTPYGDCAATTVTTSTGSAQAGANSPACAWQYGYNKATQDVTWLASAATSIDGQAPGAVPGAASAYPWWLDVETVNTWQSGTSGQAMNVAGLQGMIAALQQAGATAVGAYSTASQWNQITGGTATSAAGALYGIPDWIPGAKTLSGAQSNCSLPSFTGGKVAVTQWTSHSGDSDYAC